MILRQEYHKDTLELRKLAAMEGVHHSFYPEVRASLVEMNIHDGDWQEALKNCNVVQVQRFPRCTRYVAEGHDTDGRKLRMQIAVIHGLRILEFITITT